MTDSPAGVHAAIHTFMTNCKPKKKSPLADDVKLAIEKWAFEDCQS